MRTDAIRLAQAKVREFHSKFGCAIGDGPGLREAVLRRALIVEEALETSEAISRGDLPEAVDGLCDLIYVCLGAAITWGVDLDPIFRAVHESNMAKEGGATRIDGKILKPPGWTPPDVAGLLREQGWGGK